MYKISFIAPSGYGKSTAIRILSKKYDIASVKIAEPLYYLQNYFYKFINTKMNGEQDGELLQFLGIKIRKENSGFLLNNFTDRIHKLNSHILIANDDCRPPDYEYLKSLGFVFIGINGFNRDRFDHCKADPNLYVEWRGKVKCDYYIDNFGNMTEYENNLEILIKTIQKERGWKL